MALTYARIIELAKEDAKVPGYNAQAGDHLNMVLQDLALNYDFDLMKDETFSFLTGTVSPTEGPYPLPADYLRHAPDEVRFIQLGTPFNLYQKPLAHFKRYWIGEGIGNYPEFFSTDVSVPGAAVVYIWPPANGSYDIEFPYYKIHTFEPDAANSLNIPWFPSSFYLIKETAARLSSGVDDNRAEKLSFEAERNLTKYLKMKDDQEGYAITVKLDRNNFSGRGGVRGTKANPWGR